MNEAQFNELYAEIAPALYAWARARIRKGRGVQLDAADLIQEVWCRAWKGVDARGDDVPLRPWLFRIAKNVLLEALRSKQKHAHSAGSGPSTRHMALHNAPDFATTVSRRMVRDESLMAFDENLQELPDSDRELVLLCGLEGLPLKEVSTRLDINLEALTKRWQRLRERLHAHPGFRTLV